MLRRLTFLLATFSPRFDLIIVNWTRSSMPEWSLSLAVSYDQKNDTGYQQKYEKSQD
jgi:hypothetical protein